MKKNNRLAIIKAPEYLQQFTETVTNVDFEELVSYNNKVIEDMHNPKNTQLMKETYIDELEEVRIHLKMYSRHYYRLNGEMPDGYELAISYEPDKVKQFNIYFKIDDWSELELKSTIQDITFCKIGTGKQTRYNKKIIGIDPMMTTALMILSNGILHYHDFSSGGTAISNSKASIKNCINRLNKLLKNKFSNGSNELDNPIYYLGKNKGWETAIKITILDYDEYMITKTQEIRDDEIWRDSSVHRRQPDYNDNIADSLAFDKENIG
ncbi:MAG: hypothetical protein CMP35_00645 [Rickettsiales bacterium]|nr:hypothetical protein [Rickettsiales bacterium]|tara:strand:- start:165 stop:962 length:798 start_codon:yes stop_codon:yes gene_type:complete